ncbi:regulatory protein ArsR [Striga asiatica]|uniref:Regulatory protein ArsR n=1 Tax=Striga asiatica TaxID=4170 RepID=A0A5A7PI79_STRAF|nr:regulatory protein ArsR [Striga asiatica]
MSVPTNLVGWGPPRDQSTHVSIRLAFALLGDECREVVLVRVARGLAPIAEKRQVERVRDDLERQLAAHLEPLRVLAPCGGRNGLGQPGRRDRTTQRKRSRSRRDNRRREASDSRTNLWLNESRRAFANRRRSASTILNSPHFTSLLRKTESGGKVCLWVELSRGPGAGAGAGAGCNICQRGAMGRSLLARNMKATLRMRLKGYSTTLGLKEALHRSSGSVMSCMHSAGGFRLPGACCYSSGYTNFKFVTVDEKW